ncbi:MAG: ABC-type branched-subunit amino acid transport system substrate-binding protein [Paraglaciecola sp.]|jgi:ABC-type branched-subunit amino acid transport system substrate-binding protein
MTNNTNKVQFFTLLFGVLLLVSSCDMFKPARDTEKDKVYKDSEDLGEIKGTRVYNPVTGEWETVQEVTTKLDTVEWTSLPPNKFLPITSDEEFTEIPTVPNIGGNGSILKGSYDITMMLPFNAQYGADKKLDKRSKWAVNFYAGSRMALDALREEGLNLRVEVLDTRGSESRVNSFLASNEAVQNADAIVGPYRRNNINKVVEWAKKNGPVIVSPFSASMQMTSDNPNYLQVNPSIQTHCEAIMEHAMKKYDVNDMVIVARDEADERSLATYMQKAKVKLSPVMDTASIRQYLVKEESADFHEMQLQSYVNSGQTTVFLVPSYKSETFVYAFLRKLAIGKKADDRIIVYGLPTWQNFGRIDFDYYENLNVHVSSGSFVDSYNPEVRLFKKKYFERFKIAPEDEAVLGYDVTMFTGRMLQKYGTKFPLSLDQEEAKYLQSSMLFAPVLNNPTFNDNDVNRVDYFENKYVHILKFDNYYFQPAD